MSVSRWPTCELVPWLRDRPFGTETVLRPYILVVLVSIVTRAPSFLSFSLRNGSDGKNNDYCMRPPSAGQYSSIGTRRQQASVVDGYVQSYFISPNFWSQAFYTGWTEGTLHVGIESHIILLWRIYPCIISQDGTILCRVLLRRILFIWWPSTWEFSDIITSSSKWIILWGFKKNVYFQIECFRSIFMISFQTFIHNACRCWLWWT